ncbi:hypothetical protein RHSIM_Rhsim01G0069700 [Rhododendron simsii]|uniref:Uncharacterized protein n=1 Tax=Rhododendron simsii TaxID=118357 RepID=A0A834HGN9_RHOSS|nr:hypothetical protein RHSIM_Rhsim01G0069700 [Rhododendron simsii]
MPYKAEVVNPDMTRFTDVKVMFFGVFNLSDACWSGAKEGIKELKLLGVQTAMRTGDCRAAIVLVQDQGVLVFLAAKSGIIKDAEEAAEFQDFIICAENGRKQRK